MSTPPSSGPPIMASDMTATKYPWKRPRSRGGTRSPMIAITLTISPPAPRPCTARNAISSAMLCDSPDSTEPTRKTAMANTNRFFRPYRSPSLPYSGVEMVVASVYAVTTQDRCSTPPSSPTIRGMAVPTTMLSSWASSIAMIKPGRTINTPRRAVSDAVVVTGVSRSRAGPYLSAG